MTDLLAYIATPSRSLTALIRQWFDRRQTGSFCRTR